MYFLVGAHLLVGVQLNDPPLLAVLPIYSQMPADLQPSQPLMASAK
jgi:hypothetical protein